MACEKGHLSCVKVLIDQFHADPNCKTQVSKQCTVIPASAGWYGIFDPGIRY